MALGHDQKLGVVLVVLGMSLLVVAIYAV